MSVGLMRGDYEKLLIKLLSIESVSHKPKKLVQALEFLIKLVPEDFSIERFSSNGKPSVLIYPGQTRPKKFEVLLNAHLDTVPAKPSQFKPRKTGGKLYARGACDMKSAALVITLAFVEMAGKINQPVGLQLVTDEELGGSDGTGYQMSQGLKANFAIIGEQTDLEINTESKGVCMIELTARGRTAHSAYQWQGESAVDILLPSLAALRSAYPLYDVETWGTSLNIGIINTPNTAVNALADTAVAHLDFRFINNDPVFSGSPREVTNALRNTIGGKIDIDIVFFEKRHFVSEDNPHVKLLAKALKKNTGQSARFVQKHGSSDVRYYTKKGIEGITFGPLCSGPHCDNECVDLNGLQTYYKILCNFMESL